MERVCILTIDGILIREALPSAIVNQVHTSALDTALPQGTRPEEKATAIPGKIMTADEIKKNLILEHLTAAGGNIKKASDSLGISRRTLYRKLEKYEIDPNKIRYGNPNF